MDNRVTLDEILAAFPNNTVYCLDEDTISEMIVVVDKNGYVYVTFEVMDYESDGTPNVYQVYDTHYDHIKFTEVAYLWADTVTKIQGGIK